jgi:hypothetical protein
VVPTVACNAPSRHSPPVMLVLVSVSVQTPANCTGVGAGLVGVLSLPHPARQIARPMTKTKRCIGRVYMQRMSQGSCGCFWNEIDFALTLTAWRGSRTVALRPHTFVEEFLSEIGSGDTGIVVHEVHAPDDAGLTWALRRLRACRSAFRLFTCTWYTFRFATWIPAYCPRMLSHAFGPISVFGDPEERRIK